MDPRSQAFLERAKASKTPKKGSQEPEFRSQYFLEEAGAGKTFKKGSQQPDLFRESQTRSW